MPIKVIYKNVHGSFIGNSQDQEKPRYPSVEYWINWYSTGIVVIQWNTPQQLEEETADNVTNQSSVAHKTQDVNRCLLVCCHGQLPHPGEY